MELVLLRMMIYTVQLLQITRTGEPLECSGTGEFEIIGSGFFDIVAIPEITCVGAGESFAYDIGTIFISRGNFACNGSAFFFLNGTGEIESVTTVRGNHNCTDMPVITSGSGVVDVVTCTGEGDYVIVGDGNFYINQTDPGLLQCSGEVISVLIHLRKLSILQMVNLVVKSVE